MHAGKWEFLEEDEMLANTEASSNAVAWIGDITQKSKTW